MSQRKTQIMGEIIAETKGFIKARTTLISYCRSYIVPIIIAFLAAIGSAILSVLGPEYISQMVQTISEGASFERLEMAIDMGRITQLAVILVCIYGASMILGYAQLFIMSTISCLVGKKMRSDISAKINRMPLKYFDTHSQGDTLSRVTNDVDTVVQSLDISIGIQVSAFVTLTGSTVMMFITEWRMALTAIISSLLGFVTMRILTTRSKRHFLARQESLAEVNSHIEEYYSGQSIVQAYSAEEKAYAVFSEANEKLRRSAFKAECISGLVKPIMNFAGNFAYVAICIVGATLAYGGDIGFEVVIAFLIYVRLFTTPLEQLGQSFSTIQSGLAASERVRLFMKEDELSDESEKTFFLTNVKGEIIFDHVSFGYLEDQTIIHDFSLNVKPGQKVAIVGPAGSGKTTIVNLLMRFYEVNKGRIYVDGIPLSELTRQNVHDLFGMVLQDTWLFKGTIRENLVYGKEGISDEKLLQILDECSLKHFIEALPNGLDTVVDENVSISVGQKQLLTIARTMVENAPMLIFDEASSSVDTRTEEKIQSAIYSLTKGRTSFAIAHRLGTIKHSDVIVFIQDGEAKEIGTHDELLKRGGLYADLYYSQFAMNS